MCVVCITALSALSRYDWLWKDDMNSAYNSFIAGHPSLDDYALRLGDFESLASEIERIPPVCNIGALQLRTQNLKTGLVHQVMLYVAARYHNSVVNAPTAEFCGRSNAALVLVL